MRVVGACDHHVHVTFTEVHWSKSVGVSLPQRETASVQGAVRMVNLYGLHDASTCTTSQYAENRAPQVNC